MFKRVISLCLVVLMVMVMIPINFAYAAPSIKYMTYTTLSKYGSNHSFHAGYNFSSYGQMPDSTGPVYDNPINGDFNNGTWKKDSIDGKGVTRPGERDRAALGFAVNLERQNMLGASINGELTAYANVYYDNYKGDSDYGAPLIAQYRRDGSLIATDYGSNEDVSNWINNNKTIAVPSGTAYLIFGAKGKRSGGLFNKDLDFNVNNIYGMVTDNTAPSVVLIENDNPNVSENSEKLKQNPVAKEPNVYITMSEDISSFSNAVVRLTASDGSVYDVELESLSLNNDNIPNDLDGEINYSTGDVKYKFRIKIENIAVQKHFVKVTLKTITATDTFGNVTTDSKGVSCNKRIDTKPPIINVGDTPNKFNVEDYFGLSKITKTINTNSPESLLDQGEGVIVANKDDDSKSFSIENTTSNTGLFNVKIDVWDLASLKTSAEKTLFMISNKEPVKFTLENSSNPLFNISKDDVKSNTKNALTNMYLKTEINPSYLSGAVIYYKWHNIYDESILTENPDATWSQVTFKSSTDNETNPITIPVEMKSEGLVNYLKPKYESGYLYIIPKLDDDTTTSAIMRTGSMSLDESGVNTGGNFKLVDSKSVEGVFVDRGCDCTGQNYTGETAEDHYGAIRNHSEAIGFNVTKNHEYLNSINGVKYFINKEGSSNSYVSQGSINKNDSGQYNIPISDISGSTGKYTVTVALYSNKGDVTLQKINVNIENPIIGISNVLYNQVSQNLEFTVTYNKNSIYEDALNDIHIELCDKAFTEFQNVEAGTDSISIYSVSEGSVIAKENWDTDIGDKVFIRTQFVEDANDSNLMKADFRASLSNMEIAGDSFIKKAGAKRVHLRYTTSNNVKVFNNNITVIKKSNVPPSISMTGGQDGTYLTSTDYNNATDTAISIKIDEPIVSLEKAYYKWVESANDSLIQSDGSIIGEPLTVNEGDKIINLTPKDIPTVTAEVLYKPYYLAVYAENEAEKYVEKSYGPFYVLNENINDVRFNITATDKSLGEKQVLVAIDDKLHMIDEVQKANKVRLIWEKEQTKVVKTYDLSFQRESETTNLSVLNIPYIELSDTNGVGGTFKLTNIEIYNSANETEILKGMSTDIIQILPEHFVSINGLSKSSESIYGVNVKSDVDEISYQWSRSPYELPISWVTTQGAITGIDFIPTEKGNIINNSIYFFAISWNKIYKSNEISLELLDSLYEIKGASAKIGEASSGYYGMEDGTKDDALIRITVKNADDIEKIVKVECYDLFNDTTSSTAINVSKMFKISDNEIAGFIPKSIVTSGGAINCNVSINGFSLGETIVSSCSGDKASDLSYTKENRTITLTSANDYSKYKLYQKDGTMFIFDENGKTEIYDDGDYLLVYVDNQNSFFAQQVTVSGTTYSTSDITTELIQPKPSNEIKVKWPVKGTITMPKGSVIADKYGVINNVANINGKVAASLVVTKSAIYSFNVTFANSQSLNYAVDISYIDESCIPNITTVTSSTAINYNPAGPALTKYDVTSILTGQSVLNNNNVNNYTFDKNGKYSFLAKDLDGNLIEYVAAVDWIDKKCPEPTVKKYVWYDSDNDDVIDAGEKGSEILKGYKTKHNVIVELLFPHVLEEDRPVKLNDSTEFIIEDPSVTEGFAYKYVYAYKPLVTGDSTPVFRQNFIVTDTLANTLNYNLVIEEIDRTDLLTQLNYSTTNYTNRDVVVSMSANRPIKRFDYVNETDDEGNITVVEEDASPTYIFKTNGTKDFNYRQIEVVQGEEESGTLKANVTWIDKSVPSVETEYGDSATNSSVVIKFIVKDGVLENARLKYGDDLIALLNSGADKVGTFTVYENGIYHFEVSNKYGNVGDVIVPINNIDTEAPVLSITGRNNVYLRIDDDYYDKGATSLDNKDGDITDGIKVLSNVNTSIPTGDTPYEVIYTSTDASGNVSVKTRYVHVLDIDSAVTIVENNVIDLNSTDINDIKLTTTGVIFAEFVGIDGNYTVKYAKGQNYDNAYFKTNGSYISKLGTFTAQEGIYTLFVQDQERNTRIIILNFTK